jgi:hypothetical protein
VVREEDPVKMWVVQQEGWKAIRIELMTSNQIKFKRVMRDYFVKDA